MIKSIIMRSPFCDEYERSGPGRGHHLLRGAIPQDLAWARIESIRHALHRRRRHRVEIGALRKIAADPAIRMFV